MTMNTGSLTPREHAACSANAQVDGCHGQVAACSTSASVWKMLLHCEISHLMSLGQSKSWEGWQTIWMRALAGTCPAIQQLGPGLSQGLVPRDLQAFVGL